MQIVLQPCDMVKLPFKKGESAVADQQLCLRDGSEAERETSSEGKTHTNVEQIKASWYPVLRCSHKQFLNIAVSTSFLKAVFLFKCCPLVAPSSHSTSLPTCPLRAHLLSLILSNAISHQKGDPPVGLPRRGNVLFLFSFLRQGFTHFVTLAGLQFTM